MPRVVASHLLLRKPGSILLLRRFQTGWSDGLYSVIAGHVEPGESPVEAVIREAGEEAGLQIESQHLEFVHAMHRRKVDGEEKLDIWFACGKWIGTPYNAEPDKCDDLRWFDDRELPAHTVDYVRTTLGLIHDHHIFSTYAEGESMHVFRVGDRREGLSREGSA